MIDPLKELGKSVHFYLTVFPRTEIKLTQNLFSILVRFQKFNGEIIKEVEGNVGDDLVDLAWEYDIDIEGM